MNPHDFTCFKCQDGNTPLYCLNCANEELKAQLDSLHNAIFRAFGALPGVSAKELVATKAEHFRAQLESARSGERDWTQIAKNFEDRLGREEQRVKDLQALVNELTQTP